MFSLGFCLSQMSVRRPKCWNLYPIKMLSFVIQQIFGGVPVKEPEQCWSRQTFEMQAKQITWFYSIHGIQ